MIAPHSDVPLLPTYPTTRPGSMFSRAPSGWGLRELVMHPDLAEARLHHWETVGEDVTGAPYSRRTYAVISRIVYDHAPRFAPNFLNRYYGTPLHWACHQAWKRGLKDQARMDREAHAA